MDYKKVVMTSLVSMLLISSSGGMAVAANTNSVSGNSLQNGYTTLKRSEGIAKTNFVSKSASKKELLAEDVNVVAPKVSLEVGTRIPQINKQIEIPFTQDLDTTNQEFYASDLIIRQLSQVNVPTLIPMIDYTTVVEGNSIIVTFLADYADEYAVQVKDSLYIRANGIPASQSAWYITTQNTQVNTEIPKVRLEVGTKIPQINKQIEIPFTQDLDTTNQELYANDLIIRKLSQLNVPTLIPMIDYTTVVEGNSIIVTFLADYADEYAVQVKDSLYIRANGIPASQSAWYITTQNTQVNTEIPKVRLEVGTKIPQINKQIEIPFTQDLDTTNQELYANDLIIRKLSQLNVPILIPMIDYTTVVEGNSIIVTFLADYMDEYAVQVKDSSFIRANGIPASQSEVFTTTRNVQLIE
ncbi:hypothetical protein [Paenibacillus sp. FSL H8-0283]|uniref:hypothetical protein n=1 Tax=Paenibacillus sp. FSL H8-0283 TaxID=2921383 RepID=UPI00324BE67C